MKDPVMLGGVIDGESPAPKPGEVRRCHWGLRRWITAVSRLCFLQKPFQKMTCKHVASKTKAYNLIGRLWIQHIDRPLRHNVGNYRTVRDHSDDLWGKESQKVSTVLLFLQRHWRNKSAFLPWMTPPPPRPPHRLYIYIYTHIYMCMYVSSFLWLWFQCVCPLMPSCNTYHLTLVSLTLDVNCTHPTC